MATKTISIDMASYHALAAAIANALPVATSNTTHFHRVPGLLMAGY